MAAGLGVTALLGVLVLKWKLPKAEVALLVLLCVGLAALVLAANRTRRGRWAPPACSAWSSAARADRRSSGSSPPSCAACPARWRSARWPASRSPRRPSRPGPGHADSLGQFFRPAALPAHRALAGRPAAARAWPCSAARPPPPWPPWTPPARCRPPSSACSSSATRSRRAGMAGRRRLPGHPRYGHRPDLLRRAAAPPRDQPRGQGPRAHRSPSARQAYRRPLRPQESPAPGRPAGWCRPFGRTARQLSRPDPHPGIRSDHHRATDLVRRGVL